MKRTLDAFKSKETAIRNGFRKSGIYPWNPDAVDYKSLPSSAGHVSVPQSAGNVGSVPLDPEEVNLLAALEGHLTVKQFTEFQKAESDVIWRGNVADTNLFDLWQGMKKDCFATEPSHRLSANERGENFDCAADCEDAGPMTEDEAGAVPVELYQIEGGCREPSASAEDCEGAGPMAEDEARAPPQESLHNERDGSSPVSDEDAFNMSFSMPISDAPGQVKKKRTVIHPPSVATSKAFVEFMEAKEREKKEIQEAKDLKRKEREQKRAIKETEMRIKKQERDKKRTNKVEPPKKTSKPRKRQK